MARIRSTHATQWNDDDFIECSPYARLLALALRNFADDQGVFEWKPGQIKRNCLPGDACDVKPLLRELLEHNQVRQFTIDGHDYGAIRNFRKWQKPKFPNSAYPLPNELRKYVGLTEVDFGNLGSSTRAVSEIDADDDTPIPRNAEITPPVVTGNGSCVGEVRRKSISSDSKPKAARKQKPEPPGFAEFYAAYPRHEDRGHAVKAYNAAIQKAEPSKLLTAVQAYRRQRAGEDPQFTPLAASWLNGERWGDETTAATLLDPIKAADVQDHADRLMRRGKYAEGH